MSSFRNRFLKGESRHSTKPDELFANPVFDLVLTASSWDERCMVLSSVPSLQFEASICATPLVFDKEGVMAGHDDKLKEYIKQRSNDFFPVSSDTPGPEKVWKNIETEVIRAFKKKGNQLRILIDASACPRYWSLGLLAMALTKNLASEVVVFYSEGAYSEDRRKLQIDFTFGKWRSIAIPYLNGTCDPSKKRFYLASIGFEGTKTKRLIDRAEPDRVSLISPDPPVVPEYLNKSDSENAPLIEDYCIPKQQIIKSPAGDAIQAWSDLTQSALEQPISENVSYLCCGIKPQCIALALRAIVLEYPCVLYVVPDSYSVVLTKPLGKHWTYSITNVTGIGS